MLVAIRLGNLFPVFVILYPLRRSSHHSTEKHWNHLSERIPFIFNKVPFCAFH
ncbi:hypothetical protein NP493_359g10035 [Ridgeia piscesae]|uniref:Uncharacterized protein n=1 Tax=Ridgeia piscesae TaxID=27915 RepID=A0AAD9L3B4_RIDPI|nr:hypothetical protein NP493_359g10035 [Ridgeia piscesae]